MLLTVPIKLLATPEQKSQLLATTYKFNEACNWVSELAFENGVFKQFYLHDALYYELKDRFKLPSQFAVRVIARVSDSYAVNRQALHKFKKSSSVEYDERLLSWGRLETISISCVGVKSRIKIPIAFGDYAQLENKVIKKSAKISYKRGEFYLLVAVETPEASLK